MKNIIKLDFEQIFYNTILKPIIDEFIVAYTDNIYLDIKDGSVLYTEPSDKTNIIKFLSLSRIDGFPLFQSYGDNNTIMYLFGVNVISKFHMYQVHIPTNAEMEYINTVHCC